MYDCIEELIGELFYKLYPTYEEYSDVRVDPSYGVEVYESPSNGGGWVFSISTTQLLLESVAKLSRELQELKGEHL